jgi:hypothetical protein
MRGVTSATPTRRLLELALGEPLDTWVATRRAAGKSWRSIASDLRERTGGEIAVNRETLRGWFGDGEVVRPLEATA